jgi:hypothetical protein
VGCMREYEYSVQNSSLIESDRRAGGFLLSPSVPCICTLRPSAPWMGSMQRPLLHETSKVKKVGGCCFDALKTVQPPPSELLSEVGLVVREGERGRKDGVWLGLAPTLLSFGRWIFMHNSFTFHGLRDRCDR